MQYIFIGIAETNSSRRTFLRISLGAGVAVFSGIGTTNVLARPPHQIDPFSIAALIRVWNTGGLAVHRETGAMHLRPGCEKHWPKLRNQIDYGDHDDRQTEMANNPKLHMNNCPSMLRRLVSNDPEIGDYWNSLPALIFVATTCPLMREEVDQAIRLLGKARRYRDIQKFLSDLTLRSRHQISELNRARKFRSAYIDAIMPRYAKALEYIELRKKHITKKYS